MSRTQRTLRTILGRLDELETEAARLSEKTKPKKDQRVNLEELWRRFGIVLPHNGRD